MNVLFDIITINQADLSGFTRALMPHFHCAVSGNSQSYPTRKISVAKNWGLDHSNNELSILSEDDLYYDETCVAFIVKQHLQNPDHALILFYARKFRNMPRSGYFPADRDISLNDIQFLHHFELTWKNSAIKEKNLRFSESFGAGSRFRYGENKVFLADALKAGLRVLLIATPLPVYNRFIFYKKPVDAVTQKSLGAALCNIYGIAYLRDYLSFSISKLISRENEGNFFDDYPIGQLDLLIKGAYEYIDGSTYE